jgi:hypothetical protein
MPVLSLPAILVGDKGEHVTDVSRLFVRISEVDRDARRHGRVAAYLEWVDRIGDVVLLGVIPYPLPLEYMR